MNKKGVQMEEGLKTYREHIVRSEQKAQEDFDKTVITLSSGALGISFAFISDIVGPESMSQTCFLIWAWGAWSASLVCVLFSYFLSHLALRKTITKIDAGTIYQQQPGGFYTKVTSFLNIIGALLFVVGLVLIVIFVNKNLTGG